MIYTKCCHFTHVSEPAYQAGYCLSVTIAVCTKYKLYQTGRVIPVGENVNRWFKVFRFVVFAFTLFELYRAEL